MKLEDIAIAAADVAEAHGWGAVTLVAVSREMKAHPVSVARSASKAEVHAAAAELVQSDGMRYPRAAVELRIGQLSHTQRGRIVHAIAKELAE